MAFKHVEILKSLMPPLSPPPENTVDWNMARQVFGLDFPEDFKHFVHVYGNVIWCDLFRPIYPDTQTRAACEKSRRDILENLTHIFSSRIYDAEGNEVVIAPYPAQDGLLPCLTDTNSDFICWHMRGHPNDWKVAKYSVGSLFYFPFDLTQLICNWIQRIPPADRAWGPIFLGPKKYGLST